MLPRTWLERIQDMLESAESVRAYTAGMDREEFVADRKTIRAVAYEIGVIGEAARHVPSEVENRYPQVPWTEMRGIRNVVVHEYFRIDELVLWDTLTEDLPRLIPALKEILDRER